MYFAAWNLWRPNSWNDARCVWIGCVSAVRFMMTQSSVVPSVGVSVTGSAKPWPLMRTIVGPSGPITSTRVKYRVVVGVPKIAIGKAPTGRVGLSGAGNTGAVTPGVPTTVNCIICPTVWGSAAAPFGNGAFALFCRIIFVPAGTAEKSTSTSALSPGAIVIEFNRADCCRYPPSVPMTMKGILLLKLSV